MNENTFILCKCADGYAMLRETTKSVWMTYKSELAMNTFLSIRTELEYREEDHTGETLRDLIKGTMCAFKVRKVKGCHVADYRVTCEGTEYDYYNVREWFDIFANVCVIRTSASGKRQFDVALCSGDEEVPMTMDELVDDVIDSTLYELSYPEAGAILNHGDIYTEEILPEDSPYYSKKTFTPEFEQRIHAAYWALMDDPETDRTWCVGGHRMPVEVLDSGLTWRLHSVTMHEDATIHVDLFRGECGREYINILDLRSCDVEKICIAMEEAGECKRKVC